MSEQLFAAILPYREKIRRMTIIRQIGLKNGGVCNFKCVFWGFNEISNLYVLLEFYHPQEDYIADDYIPQDESLQSTPFKDLVFSLTKDENFVLSAYLQIFFDRQDETWIIIAMVLSKDIQQMIATYDECEFNVNVPLSLDSGKEEPSSDLNAIKFLGLMLTLSQRPCIYET